jgi:dTDP-4-dehydrorhamnose reductase
MAASDVLVLGAGGMLGHKVFQRLQGKFRCVRATIRPSLDAEPYCHIPLFGRGRVFDRVEVTDRSALSALLQRLRPQVVINCVGVIKQRPEVEDPSTCIEVNALLPHRLAALLSEWHGRLIQISTDCVFSGSRGAYTEDDASDAEELYGRTKALGEIAAPRVITLRTSMIGRELTHHRSLLDWLLQRNHSTVHGFTRAIYSGVTTNHLADIIGDVVELHPALSGVFQVASDPISKFDLLCLLRKAYDLDVEVVPDDHVKCDRSLNGRRFQHATGYRSPSWPVLVEQLAGDSTPYREWVGF